MKFGFGLITCQRYPGESRTDVELYRDALDLVEMAERVGFDSTWVTEHHFWDDGYMPSLLIFCTAIAARTERITIGTSILLAPFYEPLRLAEDAATVDLLSAGRFILGLGLGWMPHEFEAFHVPLTGRHRRLEETIATLRQAWAGERVADGMRIPQPGVFVTPRPVRAEGLPIWIGAQREPAIRRAARLADGFISASGFTPPLLAQQVQWVIDEAAQVGRDLKHFVFSVHRPTFAWNGSDAWERVRDHAHYVSWKYENAGEVARGGQAGLKPPPLTPKQEAAIYGGRGLIGSPAEIIEQLLAYQEVVPGELHYIARLYWPGMDPGLQRETISIFAEEVIAKLRVEHPAKPASVSAS